MLYGVGEQQFYKCKVCLESAVGLIDNYWISSAKCTQPFVRKTLKEVLNCVYMKAEAKQQVALVEDVILCFLPAV